MGQSGNPAKRAEQERGTVTNQHDDETPTDEVEDFDAFWAERDRKGPRVKIMGDVVTLPPALPLQFELEAKRLHKSTNGDDVQKLLRILFPKGSLKRWAERGMDLEQFQVLLAWAPLRIAGHDVTLREVADELAKQSAKGAPDPT